MTGVCGTIEGGSLEMGFGTGDYGKGEITSGQDS